MMNAFVVSFFLLIPTSLWAQGATNPEPLMILSHKNRGIKNILREDARIRLTLRDHTVFAGRLKIVNDSVIQINDKKVDLHEIKKISIRRNPVRIAFGSILAGVGGPALILGVVLNQFESPVGNELLILGGASVLTATIILAEKSVPASKWNYTIEKATPFSLSRRVINPTR